MVERKSSLNSFSLSMKARGATVPFSAGFEDIYTNNERSAENKLGGDDGMPGIGGCSRMPLESDVEALRSGLRRTGAIGARAGVGGGGGASASRDVSVA
jgi:hypothetical protein